MKKLNLHYFQHVPFEDLGIIEPWAKEAGHHLTSTHFYKGELPPANSQEIDWLIVLGGPMNVYEEDRYPWLEPEKQFISQAIAENKVVLGICLGAQLIAAVLGAKIDRNPQKEIGWFPVTKSTQARKSAIAACLPAEIMAFHWHGDRFALPPKSIHLARSEACETQGFVYQGEQNEQERVVGLQFHLETTPQNVKKLIQHCGAELCAGQFIQKAEEMLADQAKFTVSNGLMTTLLVQLATGTPLTV